MHWSRLGVLIIVLVVGTGCASVLSKTHQRVQLQSDVEGTQVSVEEEDSGITYGPQYTPAWVVLDKSKDYVIRFESPQGDLLELEPGREFDPVTLLNIFGVLGFFADIFTGAILRYEAGAWRAEFAANRVAEAVPDRALPHLSLPRYTARRGAARSGERQPREDDEQANDGDRDVERAPETERAPEAERNSNSE